MNLYVALAEGYYRMNRFKGTLIRQCAILKTSEPALSTQLLDIIYSSKVIRLVK